MTHRLWIDPAAATATATALMLMALPVAGVPAAALRGDEALLPAGVCRGAQHCRVVSHADVDGDGQPDQVGWVARHAHHAVVIRVVTDAGDRASQRVSVRYWLDRGAWGGAAPVDRAQGAELLVGSSLGAHTPGYTMLTYRGGELVVEAAPGNRGRTWYVDAAASVYLGWWRRVVDGRVTMTRKYAGWTANQTFKGSNTTYAWRAGDWVKVRHVERRYPGPRRASQIAGWHVASLKQFPGL